LPVEILRRKQANGSQAPLVPEQQFRLGWPGQGQHKSQVFLIRGVGGQDQARHARLDHDPLGALQLQHDPLAESADLEDSMPSHSALEFRQSGGYLDRPQPAARLPNAGNPPSGKSRNSASHGFDFRQFGHVAREL
jgi:hypothetical protein